MITESCSCFEGRFFLTLHEAFKKNIWDLFLAPCDTSKEEVFRNTFFSYWQGNTFTVISAPCYLPGLESIRRKEWKNKVMGPFYLLVSVPAQSC